MPDDLACSRRGFLAGAGSVAAAAVVGGPRAPAARPRRSRPSLRGGRFAEGVMSGDPAPDAVTLWTRIGEVEGRGTVELEVARDRGFRDVVARELVRTSGWSGWSVKARVGGLRPHEEYWYRFSTRGEESPVGRFRTALPADSRQPVRFAFFSCQEYSSGYFNAHALLAREDVDFVLNLGDYVYADTGTAFGAVREDPVGVAETLEQYRAKYALYRSASSLRRMHERFPMVSIWDDHEVRDNYAGGAGPTGGLAPELRYSEARRAAAYRAYFESMPTFGARRGSERIFRSLRFGRTVELILLDERQYRADQPCGDAYIVPPCADLGEPRRFLGRRQMDFVKRRLSDSDAGWKVLANQVMAMPMRHPAGGQYVGFDSWQGYPHERRELLGHIRRERVEGVVFATGDYHTFIAGDVRVDPDDHRPVATEFVGGSISSPGLGEVGGLIVPDPDLYEPDTPQSVVDAVLGANPWTADADFDHHGYGLVTATRGAFRCTLRRLETIKRRSRVTLPDGRFSYVLVPGRPSLLD